MFGDSEISGLEKSKIGEFREFPTVENWRFQRLECSKAWEISGLENSMIRKFEDWGIQADRKPRTLKMFLELQSFRDLEIDFFNM